MLSQRKQRYYFHYLLFQNEGISLIGTLVGSVFLIISMYGVNNLLVNSNENMVAGERRFASIQWGREIMEELILIQPECIAPTCTGITTSCTNLLSGFEDTNGTIINYTALYSASSNLISASKLYVNSSDSDYDSSKHTYRGLQIDQIKVFANSERDNQVVLQVSFKLADSESSSALLSRPINLQVNITEYQSSKNWHGDYNKIKSCIIEGSVDSVEQGAIDPHCYLVDTIEDTPTSEYNNTSKEKGRTLLGCESTSATQSQTTAFGYQAGTQDTYGETGTFIGYKAGTKNVYGHGHTSIGYEAGSSSIGEAQTIISTGVVHWPMYHNAIYGGAYLAKNWYNTFVGYQAGKSNVTGAVNTYIGHQAGTKNRSGFYNTFVGASAGLNNTSNENFFIGKSSGENATGSYNLSIGNESGKTVYGTKNTFVGYRSGYGKNNTSEANQNTFIGVESGYSINSGDDNTLAGYKAGYNLSTGDDNVFIGSQAGFNLTAGNNNTFIGQEAGYDTTADKNTFIGYKAGYSNTSGSNNVFIGYNAGSFNTSGSNNIYIGKNVVATKEETVGGISGTGSNQLNIGNLILGKLPSTTYEGARLMDYPLNSNGSLIYGRLIVDGELDFLGDLIEYSDTIITTNPVSSRVYKKNIKPFIDYASALKDIESTSLFYYEYKQDHPDKKRMGVISEELPEHLQIRDEGVPSKPDWVSIYGSLWAGIKALSLKLSLLKAEFFQLVKKTRMELVQQWESQQMVFRKQLTELKASMNQWNEKWIVYELQTKENFKQNRSEVQALKKKLRKVEKSLLIGNDEIEDLYKLKPQVQTLKVEMTSTQGFVQKAQEQLQIHDNRLRKLEEKIKQGRVH